MKEKTMIQRNTTKTAALMLALLLCPLTLMAQQSAFNANHQKMALLPGEVYNVSVVDGKLYCYASDVLLVAQRSGEQLLGFWADTTYVRIAEGVNYVVRHPSTGDLYFTMTDKRGNSVLYCYTEAEGKKGKMKKVRMGGMDVEHPTFSTDGRIMIFSSNERRHSYGGNDLWYSLYENGKWSRPLNLGNRINTSYDEVTPSIYRDCLLFSSNGHSDDHAYLDVCSSRLVSTRVIGDTVGMLQIGRCRVQRLPEPLNSSDADDFDMAIDTLHNCGYWVSKRVESDSDSQLYSFNGALDGVLLWGRVLDQYDNALSGVRVTARQIGVPVCNTVTDDEGFYRLYLQCDQYYELLYQTDDYFVASESINTAKPDEEYLIAETRLDVTLDKLRLDERIYYSDLFGHNVDIELSDYGREQLSPLVRFLNDNPNMNVWLSLTNDLTADENFNRLLTEHRIQTLQSYLYSAVPSSVQMSFENACQGSENCSTGSGLSRLSVIISKPER